MSPAKKKNFASSPPARLARLVAAVRRIRLQARPADPLPPPAIPPARPPLSLRRQVSPAPFATAPVVPEKKAHLSAGHLRAAASALIGQEQTVRRAGLTIHSHQDATFSAHVLETARQQPPAVPEPAKGQSLLTRLGRQAAGLAGWPQAETADLQLNPHRHDADRPAALMRRVQAQTHVPAAMVSSMSEAAGFGLERVEEVMRNTLGAPFIRPGSWGERVQHIAPHAGAAARNETDALEWETGPAQAEPEAGEDVFDSAGEAPAEEHAGLSSWSSTRIGASLAALAVLAVVVLAPLAIARSFLGVRTVIGRVEKRGSDAVAAVGQAGAAAKESNAAGTASALAAAGSAFSDVRTSLGPLGSGLLALAERLPVESRLHAGVILLSAGQTFTRVGSQLAGRLEALTPDAPPTDVLLAVRDSVGAELPALSSAAADVASLDPDTLPEAYRAQAAQLRDMAQAIVPAMSDSASLFNALLVFLGHDMPERYLLVFQNQNELRPTGGFIGSFAEVVLDQGRLGKIILPPGGSYDIQGDVRAWLNPPDPLRLVTSRWRFHDANWFPDFPTSAQKLSWFYEKSGGPTVDGVIAVNATMLEELLKITGPVDMPEYGVTLNAENVLDTVQRAIEIAPADPAKPKQLLADLFPILLTRLQSPTPEQTLALADALARGLKEKRVQIYARDPDVQAVFAAQGWDGALKQTDGDYLDVVTTNVGGEKSDAMMQDQVTHDVAIQADGHVVDTVTLMRTHTGEAGVPLTGVRNISYVRVYVPAGSKLRSASGDFETPPANLFVPRDPAYGDDPDVRAAALVSEDAKSGVRTLSESGKTVFAHWMQILPGETKTIRFQYELSGTIAMPKVGLLAAVLSSDNDRGTYRLLMQKQSGAEARTVTLRIHLPPGMQPVHALPDALGITPDGAMLQDWPEASDRFFALLFAPK